MIYKGRIDMRRFYSDYSTDFRFTYEELVHLSKHRTPIALYNGGEVSLDIILRVFREHPSIDWYDLAGVSNHKGHLILIWRSDRFVNSHIIDSICSLWYSLDYDPVTSKVEHYLLSDTGDLVEIEDEDVA